MSEFQKDSLSLEETNKVRISLGLKPLQPDSDDEGGKGISKREGKNSSEKGESEDDDPLRNQEEKAARNYERYQADLRQKKEEEEIRERIAKAQNKRALNKKLQGRTLGESDEPQEGSIPGESSKSTLKWLKQAQKKAKELAARRLREEAEVEELAAANAAKYDSNDLAGLRVGHDVDDIELEAGGEGRVLTLRDSKILDGDDDELMDSALEAAEKDKLNAERKKGVKKYTGLDDEEFNAGQVGRKKSVLSKYDNDLEQTGSTRDDGGFVLGGEMLKRTEREDLQMRQAEQMRNRSLLDLDYTKNEQVSDYLQEGDVGFKKPKTKKKKRAPARIRLEEDEEVEQQSGSPALNGDTQMSEAGPSTSSSAGLMSSRRRGTEEVAIDDDDLALSLAKSRREQARKTFKKMTPEMIAKNLAAQREAEEAEERERQSANNAAMVEGDMKMEGESVAPGSLPKEEDGAETLVFDDTSEFVRNIRDARQASPESVARLQRRTAAAAEAARLKQEERNAEASDRANVVKQEALSPTPVLSEPNGIDAAMLLNSNIKEEQSDEEEEGAMDAAAGEENDDEDPSASEPLVSGGMAAALSLLRQQGLITEVTAEQKERERKQKEYDAWLATRRYEDRVREAELAASKAQGSAKDQATREYENRMRELEDARRAQDKFKNYKPDIDIKYSDEYGRTLNHHEAWKRLSHTFHGKMPGQKKQEQRLQRIMDERKREKMLAGDTPSGMTKAFADRAGRSGQAHMVLGVGSKNNAPQDMELLGPNTVARPRDKGKGKESKGVPAGQNGTSATPSNGRDPGMDSSVTGITSMVPRSTTTKSKAGFAPVRNMATPSSRPDSSSPAPLSDGGQAGSAMAAPPSKFKLAFNKRPAPNQTDMPTPPTKMKKIEGEGRIVESGQGRA